MVSGRPASLVTKTTQILRLLKSIYDHLLEVLQEMTPLKELQFLRVLLLNTRVTLDVDTSLLMIWRIIFRAVLVLNVLLDISDLENFIDFCSLLPGFRYFRQAIKRDHST